MTASDHPAQLLSPPPPSVSPQYSRKSNSSIESRGSYFSAMSLRTAVARMSSQSEGPLSGLPLGMVSSVHAFDYGSDYSIDSSHLTPSPSQGEDCYEKPPYKARSAKSPSLDMSAERESNKTQGSHKNGAEKRHSRHRQNPPSELSNKHGPKRQDHQFVPPYRLLGCKGASPAAIQPLHIIGRLGEFVENIGVFKNSTKQTTRECKACSSQFMSAAAANITARRWNSVGIGAYQLNSLSDAKLIGNGSIEAGRKRSNSWSNDIERHDLMMAVRARLMVHEVPGSHLPTPTTITLRRATKVNIDNSRRQSAAEALTAYSNQWSDAHRQVSSYLITDDDIDFITNLIRSVFDNRKTSENRPRYVETAPRKPNVTSQGVMPKPSNPAELATTRAIVYQTSEAQFVSFDDGDSKVPKRLNEDTRNLSRVFSLKSVPEIIWEDTRSQGSMGSTSLPCSTKTSPDVTSDSNTIWLLGNSFLKSLGGDLSRPVSPKQRQHENTNGGDNSPTSDVYQWNFKEPTENMIVGSGQSPKQSNLTSPNTNAEVPAASDEGRSGSPISLVRPDVVSFPPLPARKFTSDWISPLPDMCASLSGDSKYPRGTGIDTRASNLSKSINAPLLDIGIEDTPILEIGHRQEPQSPDSDSSNKKKSVNLLHLQVCPRLGDLFKVGNAIGSSSGARRKGSTRSARIQTGDDVYECSHYEDQSPWTGSHKDSEWPSLKTPPTGELNHRRSSHALLLPGTHVKDLHNKGEERVEEKANLMGGLAPPLLKVDHVGTCGTNCGSHVCCISPVNSESPSVDWIG